MRSGERPFELLNSQERETFQLCREVIVWTSDENVYFYMGKVISDGGVPYKDFFYAHPPLHIYILAFLIKLFGVNIAALKFFSLFAIVVSAFFLYKSSMKIMHRDDSEYDSNSVYISLVAVILFLFYEKSNARCGGPSLRVFSWGIWNAR